VRVFFGNFEIVRFFFAALSAFLTLRRAAAFCFLLAMGSSGENGQPARLHARALSAGGTGTRGISSAACRLRRPRA
jgi:hypothetical protein